MLALHLSQWSAGAAFLSLAMVSVAATHAFGHDLAAAGIRGRVTDASGAAVVGVAVTATSPALLVAQVTT
jgi:hypothetical protein